MDRFYSKIGDVQAVLQHNYDQQGVRTSFVDALIALRAGGKLYTTKPEVPPFYDVMEDEAFQQLIKELPVNASQIIRNALSETVITEDKTIPGGKDVFAIKHIPYVDDSLHAHDYFEINYMYSGSCVQIFENERRTLNEGDLCIIAPYSPHNILVDPSCLALCILMRKSTFDKIFWRLLTQKDLLSIFFRNTLYESEQSNYLFLQTDNLPDIKRTIQNIMVESHREDSYANSCATSLVNLLFAKILRVYSETIEFYNMEPHLARELDFSLLLQYIQQNYSTVTLQSLAQTFHYSDAYLSRLIKKNLNQNFATTLRNLKMNHAVDALRNTQMKVHEISEMVGYDSVDHFSRTFKKLYHMSPQEYRKTLDVG